jgi:hypothetical protein
MLNLLATVSTVKLIPLLARPPTVTTTFPVEDPSGTVATIDVSLQLTTKAGVPLNVTVLDPWDEPKFDPEIVTAAPTTPLLGDKLLMLGGVTVIMFVLDEPPPQPIINSKSTNGTNRTTASALTYTEINRVDMVLYSSSKHLCGVTEILTRARRVKGTLCPRILRGPGVIPGSGRTQNQRTAHESEEAKSSKETARTLEVVQEMN